MMGLRCIVSCGTRSCHGAWDVSVRERVISFTAPNRGAWCACIERRNERSPVIAAGRDAAVLHSALAQCTVQVRLPGLLLEGSRRWCRRRRQLQTTRREQ